MHRPITRENAVTCLCRQARYDRTVSKKEKKSQPFRRPPREIGDTALEMKAIPFFVDRLGKPTPKDDSCTLSEMADDELKDAFETVASFDDNDDDDTVTVEGDFDEFEDATDAVIDDD